MTQLLERSQQEQPLEQPTARTLFGAGDRGRSVQIGLVLAIIIWCGLLFLIQKAAPFFGWASDTSSLNSERSRPMFSIELMPEGPTEKPKEEQLLDDELKKLQQPKPPEEKQLVPINPDAPDNVPDNTRNLGARNQQAAQETPNLGKQSDMPSLEGDPEFGSVIKQGPLEPAPAIPQMTSSAEVAAFLQKAQTAGNAEETVQGMKQATAARDILSGNEKLLGENEHSVGSNVVKLPPKAPLAETRVEGTDSLSLRAVEAKLAGADRAIDPKQPRPRPRLDAGQTGALIENAHGTNNKGIIASDSRWSQYGEYDQKMWETIVTQWQSMLTQQRLSPIDGSYVIVAFRLNDRGEIPEVINIESTAGLLLERLCVSAITTRAPYGAWPNDMRDVLGSDIVLRIKFQF